MTDPIQFASMFTNAAGVAPGAGIGQGVGQVGSPEPVGKDFRTILVDSLAEVDRLQREADEGVQKLMTGETDNVTEVFSAVNKAGIAFDLLMEVRNKLTQAYDEIQQMRV